jgi:hypothetical protein
MGDEPIIIEQFFMGSRGLFWARLWEVKKLWVWIMGGTLVLLLFFVHRHLLRFRFVTFNFTFGAFLAF